MLSVLMMDQLVAKEVEVAIGHSSFDLGEVLIVDTESINEKIESKFDLVIILQTGVRNIVPLLSSDLFVFIDEIEGNDNLSETIIKEFMMIARSTEYKFHKHWYKNLEVYYQPIHFLQQQEIIGYEALSRVNTGSSIIMPELALFWLSPQENVLLIEQALKQAQQKFGIFQKTQIFINIECSALVDMPSFNLLKQLLCRHNSLYPNLKVVLEITESQLDRTNRFCSQLDQNLAYLNRMGVVVAIDDFGSEASNYDRLRRFKPFVQIVKIDKSHFWSLQSKTEKNSINAMLELIKSLKIKTVIIEGIETSSHLDSIYDVIPSIPRVKVHAQGYYLGKPNRIPVQSMVVS